MSKTLRELQSQRPDLAARVASMRSQGYHASADVLADRLGRLDWQIAQVERHQRGASERKVLVTPSIVGQSGHFAETQRRSPAVVSLARNTVVHG